MSVNTGTLIFVIIRATEIAPLRERNQRPSLFLPPIPVGSVS